VRVHRHFWMRVAAELLRALDANSAIAQRRAFRRAGHYTDVRKHLSYARARADHWATGRSCSHTMKSVTGGWPPSERRRVAHCER